MFWYLWVNLSYHVCEKGNDIITGTQGLFALLRLIWPTGIKGILSAVYQNHHGYLNDGVINTKFVRLIHMNN